MRWPHATRRRSGASKRCPPTLPRLTPVLAEAGARLYRSQRTLAGEGGLPGRPWFKHRVYAPGSYTGYGVKTMAVSREAVEDRPVLEVATPDAAPVAEAIRR